MRALTTPVAIEHALCGRREAMTLAAGEFVGMPPTAKCSVAAMAEAKLSEPESKPEADVRETIPADLDAAILRDPLRRVSGLRGRRDGVVVELKVVRDDLQGIERPTGKGRDIAVLRDEHDEVRGVTTAKKRA